MISLPMLLQNENEVDFLKFILYFAFILWRLWSAVNFFVVSESIKKIEKKVEFMFLLEAFRTIDKEAIICRSRKKIKI